MNLLSRHPVQTLLLSIISVLSLISKPDRALSVPLQSFYPFDRQDFQLPGNEDDISSSTITLSVPVKFFGYTYSYIYVSNVDTFDNFIFLLNFFFTNFEKAKNTQSNRSIDFTIQRFWLRIWIYTLIVQKSYY